jgi:HSP20 family protein
MAAMQSALDRVFDQNWGTSWPFATGNALPLDMYENDNEYVAVVALPGVNEDQINIRFENGVLTISAEVPQVKVANARVLVQEIPFGRYSRSVTLPQMIAIDQAEAHYENGILTLTLPKAPEAQPKLIPIKANNGRKQLKSGS